MNFFSIFARKAKGIKSCSAVNYACDDEQLEFLIKEYYSGTVDAERCLQNILRYIERYDVLHIKENQIIFPLICDALAESEWKTDYGYECGDFDPNRTDRGLSAVSNAYRLIYRKIRNNEEILTKTNGSATTADILSKINKPYVTEEMVENPSAVLAKAEEIEAYVKNGKYSPYEALHLIKENWHVMYANCDAYEAIDYCITCSKNVTIPPYFDAELRNISAALGATYHSLKEKK